MEILLRIKREGNTLIVMVGDQMSFTDYFSSGLNQNFNRFEFADESVWTDIRQLEQFKNMPVVQPMAIAASFANTNSSSLESQTDNLVIAMATFAITGADTSLLQDKPENYSNSIMLTINSI